MRTPRATRSFGTAALSAGFVLAWSSGFVGARLGTATASTLSLLAWRFLLLAPVALAVLAWQRGRGPAGSWRRATLVGLLSQVVYLGGVVGAVECGVSAATAALVAALQPLATGALAGPLLGERVPARHWAGLVLGLGGVGLVVAGDLGSGSVPAWAYLLPVAGMLGLVAATLLQARLPDGLPVGTSLAVQCLGSAVVCTAAAASAGELVVPQLGQGAFWVSVAWFIVFSTLGGYGCYWLTLRRTGPTRLSSLIYLTPPTTTVWTWLMFGDALHPAGLLGLAVCAGAVLLVFLPGGTGPAPRRSRAVRSNANGTACVRQPAIGGGCAAVARDGGRSDMSPGVTPVR